MKKNKQKNI